MNSRFRLLLVLLVLPAALFSQVNQDTTSSKMRKTSRPVHRYQDDSTFAVLFNISNVFYTAKDSRIDNFLLKYGYRPPQNIPVGINIELAATPLNSKMTYGLSASTIVSRQDVIASFFKLAAYRRFFERKHIWISAGAAFGTHGSRVLLNGKIPPSFDSLEMRYHKELVLRRTGIVVEPAARFFWYPLQTSRFQLGLFAGVGYDFSFNRGWKVGYYNPGGGFSTFRGIGKTSDVLTHREFGWALSDGISLCFKFD